MIVVSDTTPLISFLKINKLDVLEKLFAEVLIPQAVFNELIVDERFQVEADLIKSKKFIKEAPANHRFAGAFFIFKEKAKKPTVYKNNFWRQKIKYTYIKNLI